MLGNRLASVTIRGHAPDTTMEIMFRNACRSADAPLRGLERLPESRSHDHPGDAHHRDRGRLLTWGWMAVNGSSSAHTLNVPRTVEDGILCSAAAWAGPD